MPNLPLKFSTKICIIFGFETSVHGSLDSVPVPGHAEIFIRTYAKERNIQSVKERPALPYSLINTFAFRFYCIECVLALTKHYKMYITFGVKQAG